LHCTPEHPESRKGPLLIVSGFFPPRPGGGSELLRSLLKWLDPAEYIVATGGLPHGEARTTRVAGARVHHLSWLPAIHRRGHQLCNTLQIPLAVARAAWLARRERCRAIVGVFPELQFMVVAYLVHRLTKIPLAVYFLDLMEEQHYGGYLDKLAKWLQPRLLKAARPIWTISEAVSEHLQHTHGVEAWSLVHCYNEPIADRAHLNGDFGKAGLSLFFGGLVYDINAVALGRVVRAAGGLDNVRINLFGPNSEELLKRRVLLAPHVRPGFISSREEFLAFLAAQDILVACLSWPDESQVGSKELSTIFSTKLPEYFAQGRPVLIHCPEDYFMAHFVREHDCGWVVSERSEKAIAEAIEQIQTDVETRVRRGTNALKVARLFSGERVAKQFRDDLERCIGKDRRQRGKA